MKNSNLNFYINEVIKSHPLITKLQAMEETFWLNPYITDSFDCFSNCPINLNSILEAEQRLKRFAPFLLKVFPDLHATNGIIESDLILINQTKDFIQSIDKNKIYG